MVAHVFFLKEMEEMKKDKVSINIPKSYILDTLNVARNCLSLLNHGKVNLDTFVDLNDTGMKYVKGYIGIAIERYESVLQLQLYHVHTLKSSQIVRLFISPIIADNGDDDELINIINEGLKSICRTTLVRTFVTGTDDIDLVIRLNKVRKKLYIRENDRIYVERR